MLRYTVGVDYSMSCPALCIASDKGLMSFFALGGAKKHENKHFIPKLGEINIVKNEVDKKDPILRYSTVSKIIFDEIKRVCGDNHVEVAIEGYAMGASSGLVFNIAENTQTLKLRLYNEPNFTILPSPPPTSVKKFATGKGNSKKDVMHDAFTEKTGVNLCDWIDAKKDASPINDIVDAYWIREYAIANR